MTDRLLGKVCIITGSGGGIDREAAVTFAREGALVVGCGLYVDDAEAPLVAEYIGLKATVEPRSLRRKCDYSAKQREARSN